MPKQRAAIGVILLTVLIDAMGIGLIFPVMPDLIQNVNGGSLGNAAVWGGILATAFAVFQFLFGPVLGALSDAYGRRPVLLLSLSAMAVDYLIMALAGSIWILLLGRILGGITAATHGTATAYMGDISAPDEKAKRFGLVGAAFGMGFVLGPVIGGLLGGLDPRAPFYAAAILAAANAAFGYFGLPETVDDTIRRPFSWARANPFGALKSIAAFPELRALLLILFLFLVATFVWPAIWAYFGKERYDWPPQTIGLTLALFGIFMALVQGVLIRPMIRAWGERGTVLFSFVADAIVFVIVALNTKATLAIILTPIAAIGAGGMPALQGMMSRRVGDDQQGELQGVITSINALATIIAPLILTPLFWALTEPGAPIYAPGGPFLLSALIMVVCVVILWRTKPASDIARS